jgi:hypothetical protein
MGRWSAVVKIDAELATQLYGAGFQETAGLPYPGSQVCAKAKELYLDIVRRANQHADYILSNPSRNQLADIPQFSF